MVDMDMTCAACACLAAAMLYMYLQADQAEHGKKLARVQAQLREVAARQAFLAEGMDRVEAGVQRLVCRLDHVNRERNAVTSPPCTTPKAPSSQRLGRKLDDENAVVSSFCTASKLSSATNFVRTHYPKMFAERGMALADGPREREGCQPQDANCEHRRRLHHASSTTPVPSQSRTSSEPTFTISSGSRFYSHVVESQARR